MKHTITLLPLCAGMLMLAIPAGAQTSAPIVVTLSSGLACNGQSQPQFAAQSINSSVDYPDPLFSSTQRGPSFPDISLTKQFDACSISLYQMIFFGTRVPSAVISFFASQNGPEVIRVTLTGAWVTSVADSDSKQAGHAETVTLSYEKIDILDLLTNTHTSYDRTSGTAH